MQGRGRGRGGPPFGRGGSFHGDDPRARDKAMRSIFVANVAFDTTEEQLGTLLREVGPIVNLKLIYDPGTGKPRGFGFCEYEDAETAMSAVRNLAGRELNGRPLRIDSASNAPNAGMGGAEGGARGGMRPPQSQSPQQLPPPERSMYGSAVPPENAPEVITKAVASLPPEQMFELMKQMKWFIQQNPQEARQLLLHNPQLAYALLQAQVVMKIVDVEVAHNILHRTSRGPSLATSHSPASSEPPPPPPPQSHQQMRGPPMGGGSSGGPPPPPRGGDQFQSQHMGHPRPPHPMQREERPRGPPPQDFGPRPTHGGGAPGLFDRGPPSRGSPPRERPPPTSTSHFPPRDHGPAPSQDQNKAELIMQVLSLTDDQIQMLPPDQRSSILKLKDQIARSR